jgi:hypothetical protein
MKKLFYSILVTLITSSSFSAIAQSECDSSLCAKYAAVGTYEIIDIAITESEFIGNGQEQEVVVTCDMLCFIESERRSFEDVTIVYKNFTILIFKGEGLLQINQGNE